jgi:hypothetical protein
MKRRTKIEMGILGFLLVILLAIVYWEFVRSPEFATVFTGRPERFVPLGIQDPALPLEDLEKVSKREYTGTGRDIFSVVLPPPPPTPEELARQQRAAEPPGPPRDVPLAVPFRYYGYADDPAGSPRRGFFTDGEEIWIARQGETVLMRFRIVRLGDDSAVVEESATGRRATIPMEQVPR